MNIQENITSNELFDGTANRGPRFHRIMCMLLDHFIMCLIVVPISILLFALLIYLDIQPQFIFFFILFFYYNKDFYRGKSPAKRLMGYQVINNKNGTPATEIQCFVRNLTIIVWPIEVIVAFAFPKRRIGDLLANTKVVRSEKEELTILWNEIKSTKFKSSFVIILAIGIFYAYGLSFLMPPFNHNYM